MASLFTALKSCKDLLDNEAVVVHGARRWVRCSGVAKAFAITEEIDVLHSDTPGSVTFMDPSAYQVSTPTRAV